MGDFTTRKIVRKIKRLTSMLFRDSNIECCDEPTQILFIGNAGLTTGLQRECLLSRCLKYGAVDDVIMIPDKSYCFVVFLNLQSCKEAFEDLQAKQLDANYPGPIYVAYAKTYPDINKENWTNIPPGVTVLENFIDEYEERKILECVNWERLSSGQNLKHRKVLHYGYEFQYHDNSINTDTPLPIKIPNECNILFDRLIDKGYIFTYPNQLTVNQYLPGQGIPPHIDTHSACEETILSLSLGSMVVMDFKNYNSRNVSVVLPERSLLIMTGEARYAWSHGITPRKTDIVPCAEGGLTLKPRGIRTSFTFRWTRTTECECNYQDKCDSYRKKNKKEDQSEQNAAHLEELHVHKVYEDIADHFSETRHKPWQNVLDFVLSIPCGSILIDVGCGNGKYFGQNSGIYEVGCDTSWNLSKVCKERGYQVFTCTCLGIPLKDSSVDACISIAVIHHLASKSRRMKAFLEIERILKTQGKALIYVWAKNQEYNENKSSYLKQNSKNYKKHGRDLGQKCSTDECVEDTRDDASEFHSHNVQDLKFSLPIHTNRTQFCHTDMFVPWKLKPKCLQVPEAEVQTFYRYYHVFEKEELEEMGNALKTCSVERCFYDQGNWCILIKKE